MVAPSLTKRLKQSRLFTEVMTLNYRQPEFRKTETGEIFYTVCAWCYPGETVYKDFPLMKGTGTLSHGCCEFHLWLMQWDILLSKTYANHSNGNAVA